MDKGEAKNDLVALRREICERFIREARLSVRRATRPAAVVPDGDYREAVADWHAARARVWAKAIPPS